MTRPPVDLDDSAAVRDAWAAIPLRVRPGCVDLMIMIAGEDRLASTLLLIDDVPGNLPQHERVRALARTWRQMREGPGDVAVAVAVCRAGDEEPSGEDLAWHDAIRATAHHNGITCRGVYLATDRGVVEVLPRAA